MSINKPRLAFSSWYSNLTGVSIPNTVTIGDDGDFSGKFSLPWQNAEESQFDYDISFIRPGKFSELWIDDNSILWNGNVDFDKPMSEQLENVSLLHKLSFPNTCPNYQYINIGGGQ